MAKSVTYTEEVPVNESKWRRPTLFAADGLTEEDADKKIGKLVKKYLKDKPYKKEVKDK